MSHVDYTLQDSIAVIAFGNPPVNSLSYAVRAEIAAAWKSALGAPWPAVELAFTDVQDVRMPSWR